MVGSSNKKYDDILQREAQFKTILSKFNLKITHEMMFLSNRLASFSNWQFKTGSCTADSMAYAGFYFIVDDAVKCAFCLKELDGWEETDDPWEEHISHKADCPYVKLNKREFDWTFEEFYSLYVAIVRSNWVENAKKKREEISLYFDEQKEKLKQFLKE